MNFEARTNKLRQLLEKNKIPAALITDIDDIIYYTGYKPSSNAFLIVDNKSAKFLLSPLDNEAKSLPLDVYFLSKKQDLKKFFSKKTFGYDEHSLLARTYLNLTKMKARFKPASDIIKEPRNIKDSEEIEAIKTAIKITKQAHKLDIWGKTEYWVAKQVDSNFKKSGADIAFDTIVSAGENGPQIHHIPSQKIIKPNELVIIDSGAKYNYYCADITRMFYSKINQKQKKVLEDVENIQKQIIDFIKPGLKFEDVQKFYCKLMKKNKYQVKHLFGHGVGISVHESIRGEIKENMTLTVEPGVYLKDIGCRIEDIVLVKSNGVKVL